MSRNNCYVLLLSKKNAEIDVIRGTQDTDGFLQKSKNKKIRRAVTLLLENPCDDNKVMPARPQPRDDVGPSRLQFVVPVSRTSLFRFMAAYFYASGKLGLIAGKSMRLVE